MNFKNNPNIILKVDYNDDNGQDWQEVSFEPYNNDLTNIDYVARWLKLLIEQSYFITAPHLIISIEGYNINGLNEWDTTMDRSNKIILWCNHTRRYRNIFNKED